MLDKGFVDRTELLDPLLGIVNLALEDDQGSGEMLDHLGFALLELLLPPAQFLEFPLLLLNLLLLALELDELLLRLLHLIVQMFDGFVLLEIEEGDRFREFVRAWQASAGLASTDTETSDG